MALAAAAAAAIDPGEVIKDGRNFFKSENEDVDDDDDVAGLALLMPPKAPLLWPTACCVPYPAFLCAKAPLVDVVDLPAEPLLSALCSSSFEPSAFKLLDC